MGVKRKRDNGAATVPTTEGTAKPTIGTRTYLTGKAVKDALSEGNKDALIALYQQVSTPYSRLPLAITDPTIAILQQYLDVSPVCDEIYSAWYDGDRRKDEKLAEHAVSLLAQIIRLLTPIPFFRKSLAGVINRLISPQERYHDLMCRMINTGNREPMLAGLSLASAAMQVDPPDFNTNFKSSSTSLTLKLWNCLLEGGVVKALSKMLGMRKRKKDGSADYGKGDPMDRPDVRHLCLEIISPMFSTTVFQSHSRQILKPLYSNLHQDPPVTILRLLTSLWTAITSSSGGAARKVSLTLLDEHSLEQLISLFSREEVESTTGRSVADLALAFVENVTTTPGKGVCFVDEGWYPRKQEGVRVGKGDDEDDDIRRGGNQEDRLRRGLHNRILANLVRKMGNKVVDDNPRIGQWMIKVFEACPELVSGYWSHSALAVEPRLSVRWMATMAYIGRIVSLPLPPISTFQQVRPRASTEEEVPFKRSPPPKESIIEAVIPAPLTKVHITKGLQQPDYLVQYVTATTLTRCLQKLSIVRKMLKDIEKEVVGEPSSSKNIIGENPWSKCIRELEGEARSRIPDIMVIIAFAQKSSNLYNINLENEVEEVDISLKTKSQMLTEQALRLFRLYYSTIPSISYEMKFDVGRLLVSSSSNKQERRERKEAKANNGSIVDETRSIASTGSVGTAGTAGMGGGFGYVRGDVDGFEAMSQVHVLKLLSEVKGWQWMNKAAGSQYTYFYHILQLHLASTNQVTIQHTTALLENILLKTPMYDHDPSELSLFLSCLPRLPPDSGAIGTVQQVHLLTFLDDCIKRTTKLPYRYIDEVTHLVPDYFLIWREWSLISPLMSCILEQWTNQVKGGFITQDAAGVVGRVIRRLLLCLIGKMKDTIWVQKYVEKMGAVLEKLREDGKAKEGLEGVVKDIRGDIELFKEKAVANGRAVLNGRSGETTRIIPELLDEDEWRETSFERLILEQTECEAKDLGHFESLILGGHDGVKYRYICFMAQLLPIRPTYRKELLRLIQLAMESIDNFTMSNPAKESLFTRQWVQEAYLTAVGDEYRKGLDNLVSVLNCNSVEDKSIAEPITLYFFKAIMNDKKGKRFIENLHLSYRWTSFFTPEQAKAMIEKMAKNQDRLIGVNKKGDKIGLTDRVISTLGHLVTRTENAGFAIGHLDFCLDLQLRTSVSNLIYRELKRKVQEPSPFTIDSETINKILDTPNSGNEEDDLLYNLLQSVPHIATEVRKAFTDDSGLSKAVQHLPSVSLLLQASSVHGLDGNQLAEALSKALSLNNQVSHHIGRAAISIVQHLISNRSDILDRLTFESMDATYFGPILMRLSKGDRAQQNSAMKLVAIGIQWAIKVSSSSRSIDSEQLTAMESFVMGLEPLEYIDLDQALSETIITTIIQDHISSPTPVKLITIVSQKSSPKASFIRQALQSLISSPHYTLLTKPSTPISEILPFVKLYSALFHASTYTSCQPTFIEPLLPLYKGTMSLSDRTILKMWQTFENIRHLSIGSIIQYWSGTGSSSRPLDALLSLDSTKVLHTCTKYPLRRSLQKDSEATMKAEENFNDDSIYDPVFVLLLVRMVVNTELSGLDWVEIMRSNALGIAVCTFASRDQGMRNLAGEILALTVDKISSTPFHERDQLLHTLLLLRHSLVPAPSPGTPSSTDTPQIHIPRLPTISTLFLAYALHAQSQPSHFLYPFTSRFLLQRPVFDPFDIPMFYTLLFGDNTSVERGAIQQTKNELKKGRNWIVKFIRDGTRSEADWSLIKRRNVWTHLVDLFEISTDIPFRRLILQAMESMSKPYQAARTLTHRYHIISWCHMQCAMMSNRKGKNVEEEKYIFISIVENCLVGCIDGEITKSISKDKQDVEDVDMDQDENVDGLEEEQSETKDTLKGGKSRDMWLLQAETFIKLLSNTADGTRLLILSRMLLRLSSLSPQSVAATIPNLIKRLQELDPRVDRVDIELMEITENLFKAGLSLGSTDKITLDLTIDEKECKEAVEEIGWRASLLDNELGEWVRSERFKWKLLISKR